MNDCVLASDARTVILTILSLLAIGANTSANVKRATREEAIREAVLRYQMRGWASSEDKNEKDAEGDQDKEIAKHVNSRIFFVSINGRDPSDEFLKRFRGVSRMIRKRSEGEQTKKFPGWVVDKTTKQPGIIFRADEIRWINEGTVEIEGGYHCGGLCASGEVFTVRFKSGRWEVVQSRMKWVS